MSPKRKFISLTWRLESGPIQQTSIFVERFCNIWHWAVGLGAATMWYETVRGELVVRRE